MWEHPTFDLKPGDTTLFQSLGEPARRRPSLVLYSGADAGRRHLLEDDCTVIGRSPECAVCIDSPAISRRHAELHLTGDSVVLRDLGSANGTRVNDGRVAGPRVLRDGDLLRLGNVVLRYYERQSLDALLHDRIYRVATVDAGTDVFTKKYLLEALQREIKRAARGDSPLAVVCLDLDHFKRVNDRWGHNAGDAVLRAAAATVQSALRSTDVLGRIGGEEFAVMLPGTLLAQAAALAERMRLALREAPIAVELPGGGRVMHTQTGSFGVARWTAGIADARALLGAADARLYDAKRAGRDRVGA